MLKKRKWSVLGISAALIKNKSLRPLLPIVFLFLIIQPLAVYAGDNDFDEVSAAYKQWTEDFSNNLDLLFELAKAAPHSKEENVRLILSGSLDQDSPIMKMAISICVKEKHALCGNRRGRLYLEAVRTVLKRSTPFHILTIDDVHYMYLNPDKSLDYVNPYRNKEVVKSDKLVRDVMPRIIYSIDGGKLTVQNLSREFMIVVDNLHYYLWQ